MAKTRELKRRIRSIQSTKKITRTMEMVSTSKLKRAQDRVIAARPYAQALSAAIADLLTPELAERFPLLRRPLPPAQGGPKAAAVLMITSNRGFAGAFNANIARTALKRCKDLEAEGYTVELHGVGKKGIKYFQHLKRTFASSRLDIGDRPTAAHALELVTPLIAEYEAGRLASLDVIYGQFKSALSTPPALLQVLPIEASARAGSGGQAVKPSSTQANYILLPSAEQILSQLLPLYVKNQVYRALVETAASEQGARRTAMKNATDNAGEIQGILTIAYNRARQAQITQELAEIVGGAAALAG
ncbi:MAG TPA: ATP synthase F1 subunit gamma [Gemmatimonadales bacterium]|jgi:F-type H+-transporting ATPase subunit gamma